MTFVSPPRRAGRRALFAAIALALLPLLSLVRSPPGQAGEPGSPWLAGRLLVASDQMGDSRFAESVIVMIAHDAEGAMGLVVNQPVGEMPLAKLLQGLGLENGTAEGSIRVYSGGPVQPERGFVLHSDETAFDGSTFVEGGLALTTGTSVLRHLAAGTGPKQAVFLFGYAGWGPGQLEAEIAAGAWHDVANDRELVFDRPDADKWQAAIARRGIAL